MKFNLGGPPSLPVIKKFFEPTTFTRIEKQMIERAEQGEDFSGSIWNLHPTIMKNEKEKN